MKRESIVRKVMPDALTLQSGPVRVYRMLRSPQIRLYAVNVRRRAGLHPSLHCLRCTLREGLIRLYYECSLLFVIGFW